MSTQAEAGGQVANSPRQTLLQQLTTSLERPTERQLDSLTNYRLRGWELCVCCRVMANKASRFLGQDNGDSLQPLSYLHYGHIESLLESSYNCGLCNILVYSLKHGESPHQTTRLRLPNRLSEIVAESRLLGIDTPITVEFRTQGASFGTRLPNRRFFVASCGSQEIYWYGTNMSWASLPGNASRTLSA